MWLLSTIYLYFVELKYCLLTVTILLMNISFIVYTMCLILAKRRKKQIYKTKT